MSTTEQGHLPGFEPCATLQLRILWMPDGKPSHYEIEGRSPEGNLTHFRAQGALERFSTDVAYQDSKAIFEEWAMTIARELRQADTLARRLERSQGMSEGAQAVQQRFGREATEPAASE